MKNILLSTPEFEYDIHSLVKAFYPGEEVKVSASADAFLDTDIFMEISWSPKCLNVTISSDAELVQLSPPEGDASDPATRLYRKNTVKQAIYRLLSRCLKRDLPWGALTGIRPTKLAMDALRVGQSEDQVFARMREMYYTSPEKTRLCIDIAKREREIIDSKPFIEGYSLYTGIAFCPTTCLYCSFASNPIAAWKGRIDDYLTCLERELVLISELFRDRKLYSIYIGGGTPTSLSSQELERLLSYMDDHFDMADRLEFTVEAGRPDSITEDKLRVLKAHGVDRISVNPQTMNQKTLDRIGRRHRVEDTIKAFEMARSAGFTNINMDIILGLPGEGIEEVEHTLRIIRELSPDSLTVHSLAVKRAAALSEYVSEHGLSDISITEEMAGAAARCAHDMGMDPYYLYRQKNITGNLENTGYARPGCYGIYNILMMEEVQSIAAAGAGTISKRVYNNEETLKGDPAHTPQNNRIERSENVKDLKNYLERIEEMLDRKRKLYTGL